MSTVALGYFCFVFLFFAFLWLFLFVNHKKPWVKGTTSVTTSNNSMTEACGCNRWPSIEEKKNRNRNLNKPQTLSIYFGLICWHFLFSWLTLTTVKYRIMTIDKLLFVVTYNWVSECPNYCFFFVLWLQKTSVIEILLPNESGYKLVNNSRLKVFISLEFTIFLLYFKRQLHWFSLMNSSKQVTIFVNNN